MNKSKIIILSILAVLCFISCVHKSGYRRKNIVEHAEIHHLQSRQEVIDTKMTDSTIKDLSFSLVIPVIPKNLPNIILSKLAFITSYNSETKNPNWVGWILTKEHTDGPIPREIAAFHEDNSLTKSQSYPYDIKESKCGYQKGHMCPSADNHWSKLAMKEAYLMTNICPQDRDLNNGLWKHVENNCRVWAKKWGRIYIVCGPVFTKTNYKSVGQNEVTVPEAFFKVVLCLEGTPKAIGFLMKNKPMIGKKKTDYVASVDDIEKKTKMDFFSALPDDIESEVEKQCNIENWN